MSISQPLLTVIVPVFNEERTVDALLQRVVCGPYEDKQVIIVDDGSTDKTCEVLKRWSEYPGFLVLRHETNRGKGAAIRTGLGHVKGAVTIFQDADLEYDPTDYPALVEVIRKDAADVVYGSRYLHPEHPLPWTRFRVAVVILNGLVRLLFGQRITDVVTCYKAFRSELLQEMDLQSNRFEIECELTAKTYRLKRQIIEVPIRYSPRTVAEGKKIGWRDAWRTAWALMKWRFMPFAAVTPQVAGSKATPESATSC